MLYIYIQHSAVICHRT